MKNFLVFLLLFTGTLYSQFEEIKRLPGQNEKLYYEKSSPVVISENEILIFFTISNRVHSYDSLYCILSTDKGKTWQEKSFIANINSFEYPGYLTTMKTKTGRIIIAFTDWLKKEMAVTYSDDNGYNWSDFIYIRGAGTSFIYIRTSMHNPLLSGLADGRVILSFCTRWDTIQTAFYRESFDAGQTWSDSAFVFYTGEDTIKDVSFISLKGDSIAAFYELHGPSYYGIYEKISADGGESWGNQNKVTDTEMILSGPRLLRTSDNDLTIVFEAADTLNPVSSFNDIYYTRTTGAGENWETPQRFTSYIGPDNFVNAALLNNKPFVTFNTTRFTNNPQISYAVLGETVETFKPPFILDYQSFPDSENHKSWIFNCKIVDDQSVESASLQPDNNDVIILYDDGKHNDGDSKDNIFGNTISLTYITPFDAGLIDANKLTLFLDNQGLISYNEKPSFNITTQITAQDNDQQQITWDTTVSFEYDYYNQFEEGIFLWGGGFILSGYSNNTQWSNGSVKILLENDYLPGKVGGDEKDPLNQMYIVRKEDSPFGYSWQQWKNAVSLGAEFYDGDGDGIYNPVDKNWNGTWDKNEDMPMIIGDETAWCVYNDGAPKETRRWNTVNPQGIEIQQTVFASNNPGLENTLFIRYSIVNTGTITDVMDSVYFGVFKDPDLGYYNHNLLACDTILNSDIVYITEYDPYYYGDNCPAFMTSVLQGPIVQSSSADSAYNNSGVMYGSNIYTGFRNLNITANRFFVGGWAKYNDPDYAVSARYALLGKDKFGNYPDPCAHEFGRVRGGINCNDVNPALWLSGDPVEDTGWIMTLGADIRSLLSMGPFILEKNKPQDIIIAYVLGRGTDPINSITVARENVRKAIQEYKSNFASMTYTAPPPAKPVVSYLLYHNYPNPFNPVTTIRYELPEDGIVSIEIFDILGQKVKTLLNRFQKANRYEVKFDGSSLASGIYIYRMKVNDFITSKKMVLIK